MQRGRPGPEHQGQGRIERFEQLSAAEGPKEREEVRLHAASSRLGRKIIEIEGLTRALTAARSFATSPMCSCGTTASASSARTAAESPRCST